MRSGRSEFQDEDVQSMTPLPVTPLVDCFVLILVFFLTSTSLTKTHKTIEINMAHSANAVRTVSKQDVVIIEITQDGRIFLESEPMSKTLLHRRLRKLSEAPTPRQIRIEADRSTSMQYITYLTDLLQFEGLQQVSFRTKD